MLCVKKSEEKDIQSLFNVVKYKHNLKYDLKTEQFKIIKHILADESTLGVIPTGCGKSAIFICHHFSLMK